MKSKALSRAGSLALCLALLCTLLPQAALPAFAWEDMRPYSGSCGDNASWVYDPNTQTMTISGTGVIWDGGWRELFRARDLDDDLDHDYAMCKKIIVENGITSIADMTFCFCHTAEEIQLPDGIEAIGAHAFASCEALKSIEIPSSVHTVGEFAFSACPALESVTLHEGLKEIETGAFLNDEKLLSIQVPSTVIFIGFRGIGLYSDDEIMEHLPVEGFTLYGYEGSIAQQYAAENSLTFVSVGTIPCSDGTTNHSYGEWNITKRPGCWNSGVRTRYCTKCEALQAEWLPAMDHAFGPWKSTGNLDCMEDKTETRTCARCDYQEEHWIPRTAHEPVNGTCIKCGKQLELEGTCGADWEHPEKLQWSFDEGSGLLRICGEGRMDSWEEGEIQDTWEEWIEYLPPWDGLPIKSVVVEEGVTSIGAYAFDRCQTFDSVQLPQSLTMFEKPIWGTDCCLEPYGGIHTLDLYYAGTEAEFAAIDLNLESFDDSDQYPIPGDRIHYGVSEPAEHWTTLEQAAPSCTEDGVLEQRCACGMDRSLAIPALGHSVEAWTVTEAPGCDRPGEAQGLCTRCGERACRSLAELGHDFGARHWTVTREPSCTEAGEERRICSRCDVDVSRDYGEALGHAYQNGVCTRCGEQDPDYVPEEPTPVDPTPVEPTPAVAFSDVPEGAFYAKAVAWAVSQNPAVTKGTGDGKFSPSDTCTRGQVVTFLWRAMGCPEPKTTANPFTDVKQGAFYYKAVLWAVENGVTSGTGEGRFSPEEGCTRGQVVTFLWRTEGKPGAKAPASFSDVAQGAFYAKAVAWAVEQGITKGTGDGKFEPNQTCTRGQVVTFLYRDLA